MSLSSLPHTMSTTDSYLPASPTLRCATVEQIEAHAESEYTRQEVMNQYDALVCAISAWDGRLSEELRCYLDTLRESVASLKTAEDSQNEQLLKKLQDDLNE